MFTMRHYKAIAELVGSQLLDNPTDSTSIINNWCEMFEDDNPRFKREIFQLAVNNALENAYAEKMLGGAK